MEGKFHLHENLLEPRGRRRRLLHRRLGLIPPAPNNRERVARTLRVRRGEVLRLVQLHLKHEPLRGKRLDALRGFHRRRAHRARLRFPSQRLGEFFGVGRRRRLGIVAVRILSRLGFLLRLELGRGHHLRVAFRVGTPVQHHA